jgi:hypothetical protein
MTDSHTKTDALVFERAITSTYKVEHRARMLMACLAEAQKGFPRQPADFAQSFANANGLVALQRRAFAFGGLDRLARENKYFETPVNSGLSQFDTDMLKSYESDASI